MQISLNLRCNFELLNFLAVSNFLKILFVSQDWKFKNFRVPQCNIFFVFFFIHGEIIIFRLTLQSTSDKTFLLAKLEY